MKLTFPKKEIGEMWLLMIILFPGQNQDFNPLVDVLFDSKKDPQSIE